MAVNPNWPMVVDQIAFTGDPNDPNSTPAYTDVTSRVRSFEASRGRQYEIDQNQTGEAHLVVSDKDEVLNPANTSAPSPYQGNIKPYRRYIRQAMWPPAPVGAATNLLPGQGYDPSFESYAVGTSLPWILAVGSGVNPLVQVATSQQGTKCLQYGVTAGGGTNGAGWIVNCIPGQQYTASAYVLQTVANTTQIFINGGAGGASTTTTGSYVRLSVTFTASQTTHQVWVCSFSTSLSGVVSIDAIQHETGATMTTFATSGPTIYTPFAGYVERWPSSWNHQGTYGLCTLTCVDAMATLAGTDLHTEYRSMLASKKPDYWWPLGDGSNATAFAESSGNNGPSLTRRDSKYGAATTFTPGTQITIPGEPGATGLQTDSGTQPGGSADQCSVAQTGFAGTPQISTSGASNSSPWGFSFAWWAQYTLPASGHSGYYLAITDPTFMRGWTVSWNSSSPQSFGVGFTPQSGSSASVSISNPPWGDGKPHLFAATWSANGTSGTLSVYVDGQLQGTGSADPSGWSYPETTGVVQIGAAINTGTGASFAGPLGFTSTELAIWNKALSSQDVTDLWNAGKGYPGETSGARISRLLSIGGYTGPTAIDNGQSTMDVSTVSEGQALLDACQAVTLSENGNLYVEGGTVVFKSRTDRYLKTTATWVFGENQAGGEYPYEADIAYDYDPTRVVNDVTVTRVNGAKANATDATSQKQYFRRSYQRTIGVQSDLETIDASNYLLNKGKQPIQRIARLSIKPSANPTLWPVALGARIGDRVTVKRRTPAFTMSSDFFIEKIDHANEPGSWVTDFQMSPVDRSQVWILGDATYGVLGTSTTLGY